MFCFDVGKANFETSRFEWNRFAFEKTKMFRKRSTNQQRARSKERNRSRSRSKNKTEKDVQDDKNRGEPDSAKQILFVMILKKLLLSSLIILGLCSYYYFFNPITLSQSGITLMAAVKDDIQGAPLGQQLECSKDYDQDRTLYQNCVPSKCGRFVSDSVISNYEALEMRMFAETMFSIGVPEGGVTIFDLSSGALTFKKEFINVYKLIENKKLNFSQLIRPKIVEIFKNVQLKVAFSVSMFFNVPVQNLHLTSPVFFSRITNKPALTVNDEYWHNHVDKQRYGTFHYSALLYLSNYGEDFQGGRFIFTDANSANITIEPKFGRVSAFTSGSENSHFVEQVSSGERFALIIPFTCDASKEAKVLNLK